MLTRLTDRLYAYRIGNGLRFLLKYSDLGVYGSGKCWNLIMVENGNSVYLGCWCTETDGYHCEYQQSIDKKLWTNMQDILSSADSIISALI